MDAKNLAGITEQLEKERTTLTTKAEKLRDDLSGVEGDLRKITAAISALNGSDASPQPKKGPKNKKNGKRAAGKADVIKLIQGILSEDGVIEEAELREKVESKLADAGFSRMGLALRFKEAIADSKFVDSPGGIRLNEAQTAVH